MCASATTRTYHLLLDCDAITCVIYTIRYYCHGVSAQNISREFLLSLCQLAYILIWWHFATVFLLFECDLSMRTLSAIVTVSTFNKTLSLRLTQFNHFNKT